MYVNSNRDMCLHFPQASDDETDHKIFLTHLKLKKAVCFNGI